MKKIITISIIVLLAFLSPDTSAQKVTDAMKFEAQKQMNFGRYGEAIDLLNRYISANPQRADGYNLRGLCNEKRAQYEMAVYDLRSARKLEPNNKEIITNLGRVTDAWYKLLYNKIEGHKREIAINPNIPVNYLQIGKSYKNLGEWATAEVWYDDYLTREEASADEIIRYTEILAKNGHIKKGEPILKRYTDKYPEDHRLWSRYGYFLLWLGKNKMAIDAFENALALRPFFREAMDGLDQARGKGYIYTVNDTSSARNKYNYGMAPTYEFVYAIDNYYRILKRNPKDNKTRIKLIEELLKNERFEEAHEQLEIIEPAMSDKPEYVQLLEKVNSNRERIFNERIELLKAKLEENPEDYDSMLKLASYYFQTNDFSSAASLYGTYLEHNPNDKEASFEYAKTLASNRDFQPAFEIMNQLTSSEPSNRKYNLFKAQLNVWTGQNIEEAKSILEAELKDNSSNVEALTALITVNIHQRDFDSAGDNIIRLQKISPANVNIVKLQNDLEFNKLRAEEEKLFLILEEGRNLAIDGYCSDALPKYYEYMEKAKPDRLVIKEYADIEACAENYDKAISIYNDLLADEYDIDIDIQRAKVYYYMGDTLKAVEELSRLTEQRDDDFILNLFLGDAYARNKQYSKAEDVYDKIYQQVEDSVIVLDSTELTMLNMRQEWLPTTGIGSVFNALGSRVAIAPIFTYYNDNQSFEFSNVGARFEFDIANFLTLGTSLIRTGLIGRYNHRDLTSFKWHVFLRPAKKLNINVGWGTLNTEDFSKRDVSDFGIKYEEPDHYQIYGIYENTDARLLLYSQNLINIAFDSDLFRLKGYYVDRSGIKLSGHFSYISIQDGNRANDFIFRIGKKFYESIWFGYEYNYVNFSRTSFFYYSPKNFGAHSLWADWEAYRSPTLKLNFNGKVGYVSSSDYLLREAGAELTYNPIPYFYLSATLSAGSSYRYSSSYNFLSGMLSAYFSLH